MLQPVSADLFEQLVFAKPYFQYDGLIMAFDDDRPVGFGHAGFGPDATEAELRFETGVTCLLVVHPQYEHRGVAAALLERCEQYLKGCGATTLVGGGLRPLNPFYTGLYGGSELPGVLEVDQVARQAFLDAGYAEGEQTITFHRELSGFRAPIDRQQMQLRRQMSVEMAMDAATHTWWEACTVGDFDLTRFEIKARGGGPILAKAVFRNMDTSGAGGFARAAGLIDLQVDPAHRRQGIATCLVGEALLAFQRQGIVAVEVQAMRQNEAAVHVFGKLGFERVGQGSVYRKVVAAH